MADEPVIGLSDLVTDPRPAIGVIRDFVLGNTVDYLEVLHAALDLASFTLRQFHKHPTMAAQAAALQATVACETSHQAARSLLSLVDVKGAAEAMPDFAAIDWATVIPLVMQLISLLLAKK